MPSHPADLLIDLRPDARGVWQPYRVLRGPVGGVAWGHWTTTKDHRRARAEGIGDAVHSGRIVYPTVDTAYPL